MKTSPPDDVPSTGPSLRPSTEATPDTAARTPRSYAAECQARRQAEQAHEEKLRRRRARTQAANAAVDAYMRESGTRDYPRAFLHIQRTRPELFAGMQVPEHCRRDANVNEPARQERWQRRGERIRAANAAVDEYRRTSGTTNYQTAFKHVERTRPELFAEVPVPTSLVAENFNPYHDQLGRFTTSDDAVAPHGWEHLPAHRPHFPKMDVHGLGRHREHTEQLAQSKSTVDTTGHRTVTEFVVYQGKLTNRAFRENIGEGNCLPAVMCEAIAQVQTMRTSSDEQVPSDAQNNVPAMEYYIRQRWPGINFDFSSSGGGASIEKGLPVLKERFKMDHYSIATPDQIPEALKHGPIIVAVRHGAHGHGELILSMVGPDSYNVYNPLNPVKQTTTLNASQIIKDDKGLVAYALYPLKKKR